MDQSTSTKPVNNDTIPDDSNSDKTGSEGSEGFIKVDQVIDEVTEQTSNQEEAPSSRQQPHLETISANVIEKNNHLESALYDYFDARVLDLLFWRDIRASAVIFTFSLLVLLSLRCFSIIAVVAYLALSLLAITISIRMYKFVLQTLNGTQQPNPFQSLLDFDIIITRQFTDRYIDVVLNHTNHVLVTGRDLILVRNLPSSLKFGLLMWLLTYIGSWFNGLTLLTIALVFSFSFPPLYVKYQEPIDAYNALACQKMSNLYALAKSKLPGIKQKTQ